MASGFLSLLDDIATLAKAAASTVDDLASVAIKASSKSSGVVIDDAAVTPQYVQGVAPKRELNIIKRITIGSLRNKYLIILPAAIVFSTWAPWVLPILLVIGGSFLAFEGAEKFLGWFGIHLHSESHESVVTTDSKEFENKLVSGAVRTDLILSTEIMLITLSNVDVDNFWQRLGVLAFVALLMTVLVYGVVAILVKMDDIGLAMTKSRSKILAKSGLGIVKGMPKLFSAISVIGTLAMLWVGGHIVIKSLADLHFEFFYKMLHHLTEAVEHLGGVITWVADTLASAVFGLVLGVIIVSVILWIQRLKKPQESH